MTLSQNLPTREGITVDSLAIVLVVGYSEVTTLEVVVIVESHLEYNRIQDDLFYFSRTSDMVC